MPILAPIGVDQEGNAPTRRRRWPWVLAAVIVLVLAAGTVTTLKLVAKYKDAPSLHANGLGWEPPDNVHVREDRAGPWSSLTVPARPGHRHTFDVLIDNPASVTQTILGLRYARGTSGERLRLAVAMRRGTPSADLGLDHARFTSAPTDIQPGGSRWLRVTMDPSPRRYWSKGRQEYWTDLRLRVRVGAFTRTERVSFGGRAMTLDGGS